jgi:hypothetical protein
LSQVNSYGSRSFIGVKNSKKKFTKGKLFSRFITPLPFKPILKLSILYLIPRILFSLYRVSSIDSEEVAPMLHEGFMGGIINYNTSKQNDKEQLMKKLKTLVEICADHNCGRHLP